MPADFADCRRGIQGYLRHLREKNCPLISLIFAEESKVFCAHLRHLREKICPLISRIAVIKPYL